MRFRLGEVAGLRFEFCGGFVEEEIGQRSGDLGRGLAMLESKAQDSDAEWRLDSHGDRSGVTTV